MKMQEFDFLYCQLFCDENNRSSELIFFEKNEMQTIRT